jgi:hypothetical protein
MLVGTRRTAGERDRVNEGRLSGLAPVIVVAESPDEFPRELGLRVKDVYLEPSLLRRLFSEKARPRKSEGKSSSVSSSSELQRDPELRRHFQMSVRTKTEFETYLEDPA